MDVNAKKDHDRAQLAVRRGTARACTTALAVPASRNCQTAPIDSSVRRGPVPRHSKSSGALESCPAHAGRSLGATHLHGRFRAEGNRDTSVTGEVAPQAMNRPATRLVMFGVRGLPPRAARLQDCILAPGGDYSAYGLSVTRCSPCRRRQSASSNASPVCITWRSIGTSFRATAHIALILAPPFRATRASYCAR